MNHAEHDETIGSMLASIAAALREVSEKLDMVAARVQQEIPPFPNDDDVPDQIRIRRLESWAFHASQDISRLSSRLDALDGGDPEPGTRGPTRTTPSRREVREAAEAAERAAEAAVAPEPPAPHPFRNIDGARPPLERRQSALRPTATDHLGDPTWPITVTPVPRAAHAPGGVAVVTVERETDSVEEMAERHSGATPDEVSTNRNGTRLDHSTPQPSAPSAPETNGLASVGLDAETPPGGGKAGVAAGIGVPARGHEASRQEVTPSERAETGSSERTAPQRLSHPGVRQTAGHEPSAGSDASEQAGTAVSRHSGSETPRSSVSEVPERAVSFSALNSARVVPDSADDRALAGGADRSGPVSDRATADGRGSGVTTEQVAADVREPGGARDDRRPERENGAVEGAASLGARGVVDGVVDEPATASVRGGVVDGVIGAGPTGDVPVGEHLSSVSPEDVRPVSSAGVGRARPANRLTDSSVRSDDSVRADGAATREESTAKGADDSGIELPPASRNGAGSTAPDPRAAGLTAGGRSEHVDQGTTANGFHWSFAEETPASAEPIPPRNGHARNGFTTDSTRRADSLFDDFTPRNLTTPAAASAPPSTAPQLPAPDRQTDSTPVTRASDSTAPFAALPGEPSTGAQQASASMDPFATRSGEPDAHQPSAGAQHASMSPSTDPFAARPAEQGAHQPNTGAQQAVTSPSTDPFVVRPAEPGTGAQQPNTGAQQANTGALQARTSQSVDPYDTRPSELGTSAQQTVGSQPTGPVTAEGSMDSPAIANPPARLAPPEVTSSAESTAPSEFAQYNPASDPTGDHSPTPELTIPPTAYDPPTIGLPKDRDHTTPADPEPPTATDAAGITVTGTFRAFDIERAHVDKLQAMLDELKRSAGLPPGRRDVFGPPTPES